MKFKDDRYNWERWFAWHPVKIDGFTVWLETVERREVFRGYALDCADNGGYTTEYRVPENKA